MTTTVIYLVTQFNQNGTAKPLITFFSESKAYKYVADKNIHDDFTYTVNSIELK